MTAPLIKVLKGNPSDEEVAALSAVLTQLDADARAKAADTRATRDLWGQPGQDFHRLRLENVSVDSDHSVHVYLAAVSSSSASASSTITSTSSMLRLAS